MDSDEIPFHFQNLSLFRSKRDTDVDSSNAEEKIEGYVSKFHSNHIYIYISRDNETDVKLQYGNNEPRLLIYKMDTTDR